MVVYCISVIGPRKVEPSSKVAVTARAWTHLKNELAIILWVNKLLGTSKGRNYMIAGGLVSVRQFYT